MPEIMAGAGASMAMILAERARAVELEHEPARTVAAFAALALAWISLDPYADLAPASALDLASGQAAPTYFGFAAVAFGCAALAASTDWPAVLRLRTLAFVSLAGWLLVSCLVAPDPFTAFKRATLNGLVAIVAACLPLLPRGRAQMVSLLVAMAGLVLALSYFGVLLVPARAIHQATDAVEPGLAGDWRGVFGHKNEASQMMGIFAFIGLYAWRGGRRLEGALIAASSLIFLIFTDGKTAILLWPGVFAIALFAPSWGARRLWQLAALAPLVILSLLGVGSQMNKTLAAVTASLPIDPTFTGRTDVWLFALESIPTHWLTGFGFLAFWYNPEIRYNAENGWVGTASHAHNGYLDATLSMGLPGLALALWAFVIQPLADIRAAARNGADRALLTFLTQVWMFGVSASTLETFMFREANPVWFTFLFAVFGLRYLAAFPTRP